MTNSNPVKRIRDVAFKKASPVLAAHAEAIRALGKRIIDDVIEIGRRLTEARALIAHGDWLRWLEREFGWSDDTARRFMNLYEMDKIRNLRNLDCDLPLSALYLLAARSTPDVVRTEVFERCERGEKFTHTDVKCLIVEAKQAEHVKPREISLKVFKQAEPREISVKIFSGKGVSPPHPQYTRPAEDDDDGSLDSLGRRLKEHQPHAGAFLDPFAYLKSAKEARARFSSDAEFFAWLDGYGIPIADEVSPAERVLLAAFRKIA